MEILVWGILLGLLLLPLLPWVALQIGGRPPGKRQEDGGRPEAVLHLSPRGSLLEVGGRRIAVEGGGVLAVAQAAHHLGPGMRLRVRGQAEEVAVGVALLEALGVEVVVET